MRAPDTTEEALPGLAHVEGKVCKKNIRQLFIHEGSERRRDLMKMENFYYDCIYDILWNTYQHRKKLTVLNSFNAKIVNLHSNRLQSVMLDNDVPKRLAGERTSLFHNLQMQKRRKARIIRSVQDELGSAQRSMKGLVQAFTSLRRKYDPLVVDEERVSHVAEAGRRVLPTA